MAGGPLVYGAVGSFTPTSTASEHVAPLAAYPFPAYHGQTSLQNSAFSSPGSDLNDSISYEASNSSFSDPYPGTDFEAASTSVVDNVDGSFHNFFSEYMLESEQEILFLLRHFTDNIAPWYD